MTPLQRFQHDLSELLDRYWYLSEAEKQAALTYAVMRATIVLAPSRAEQLRAGRLVVDIEEDAWDERGE